MLEAADRSDLLFAATVTGEWVGLFNALVASGHYRVQLIESLDSLRAVLDSAGDCLTILGWSLPGLAGVESLRLLCAEFPAAALMVVVDRDDYRLRTLILDSGADDVQSFPCALDEFFARLRSLERRLQRSGEFKPVDEPLVCRDLVLKADQRSVARAGESVRLTVKEFDLLLYLLRHKEQVLPRQQILHAVWGDTWVGDDNLLDVYIRYLRKKIERPHLDPLIHTIRGVGFMLK